MGKWWERFFDAYVEQSLVAPVFVTRFPVEISPLSRRSDYDPRFVDRFELIVAGQEIANGFTELTDPVEQEERIRSENAARIAAGERPYPLDRAFLRDLGRMPPAAGVAVGLDRVIMGLLGATSVDEVMAFPGALDGGTPRA